MPLSGTVPSVDSSSLDVIAAVGGLSAGDYPGSILIAIGDEEPETLRVNTTLAVTPASEVRVSPNPFNPRKETVTRFVPLVHAGTVQASVYDITGEKVKDLPDASLQANSDSITWDGKTDDGDIVANGVYFCRIVGVNVSFARTYTIVLKKK